MCIYKHTYVYMYVERESELYCTYIYICGERERERAKYQRSSSQSNHWYTRFHTSHNWQFARAQVETSPQHLARQRNCLWCPDPADVRELLLVYNSWFMIFGIYTYYTHLFMIYIYIISIYLYIYISIVDVVFFMYIGRRARSDVCLKPEQL